jgi:hypothetical protein
MPCPTRQVKRKRARYNQFMVARMLGALAALALVAMPAHAETLRDLLQARGLIPPPDLAHLDGPLQATQVLDDPRDLLALLTVGDGPAAGLHAVRFDRAASRWTSAPLQWHVAAGGGGPMALEPEWCRSGLAIDRFPGGFLVRSHINPSAECTIVLGLDLAVRGVLAGWPMATLPDGRLVYQRNQVHFAPVHPVALGLFDPARGADLALYPRPPEGKARAAHVARMRAAYTPAWCNAHNHPCDPERFDERVEGEVTTEVGGDALAFALAWDNTAGWSDRERSGRLEAFRELRAALAPWDRHGEPPAALYWSLAAGLARARNLKMESHVEAALADSPDLAGLVGSALRQPPTAGQDPGTWLRALDGRWASADTWRRLGDAVAVPEEFTEVVYVYRNLRRPDSIQYREYLRRDFEARFGPWEPRRALQPDVLRRIFDGAARD